MKESINQKKDDFMAYMKQEEDKKRWILPVVIILLTLWGLGYMATAPQRIQSQQNTSEATISQEILMEVEGEITQALYYELLLEARVRDFNWSDLIRDGVDEPAEDTADDVEAESVQMMEQDVLHEIANFQTLLANRRNLAYVAMDMNSETMIRSGSPLLEDLLTQMLTRDLLQDLNRRFSQLILVHYNGAGRQNVLLYMNDENLWEVERQFDDLSFNGWLHWEEFDFALPPESFDMVRQLGDEGDFQWQNPRNAVFVYAIPRESASFFTQEFNEDNWRAYFELHRGFNNQITATLMIAAAAAFLVPLESSRKGVLFKKASQYPFEITLFLTGFFFIQLYSQVGPISNTLLDQGFRASLRFNWLLILTILILWHLLLHCIAQIVLHLKHFYQQGFWKSFRDNSFLLRRRMSLDLSSPVKRKLFWLMFLGGSGILFFLFITALGGEVIILTGPALAFFFILLYLYLKQKLTQIQNQYLQTYKLTSKVAAGDYDVQMEEDLGPFESLKEELINIRGGLKVAVEQAVTSEKMKTDLISNVSHDLKTPLTSIITYVDLLKDPDLDEAKRVQYLTTLEKKSNRLKVLIEDLFEVSKATSGNIELDLQEIDVVALMKQTLSELEDQIQESRLQVRPAFPENKVKLHLDGQRTYRVFENLILNMAKYALPGTRAYVDIKEGFDTVTITLKNISAYEISLNIGELAERFVRGDQSRHTEGSGLGLAIAKSFVELQNGTFDVQVDGDLFKVIMTFKKWGCC